MITIGAILLFVIIILTITYCFGADVVYWWKARKIRKIEKHPACAFSDLTTYQKALETASQNLVKGGGEIDFPTLTGDTFMRRARVFWSKNSNSDNVLFRRIETGWLLSAILDNGHNCDYIKEYFDSKIIKAPIDIVDQCPFGSLALTLFEKTNDSKYKQYADKMYEWLIKQDTPHGVLYKKDSDIQFVDVTGFITPFLTRYSRMFSIKEAEILAEKTISMYLKYGCDKETGLPSFQYCLLKPHVKLGSANWGRGCAWLTIGLSCVDIEHMDEECQIIVHTLEDTLIKLWNRDGFYGQFLGEWPRDLSAELPIVYYLYQKDLISMDKKQILAYSTMCHDGHMYHSSSANMGIIRYGVPYGPQTLSQEYMMRLIGLYNSKNNK